MSIELNGAVRELDAPVTLAALIAEFSGTTRGSAVIVDGAVVPRAAWPSFEVRDGQRVEVITAVPGG